MTRAQVSFLGPIYPIHDFSGDEPKVVRWGFVVARAGQPWVPMEFTSHRQAVMTRRGLVSRDTHVVPRKDLFDAVCKALTEAVFIGQEDRGSKL